MADEKKRGRPRNKFTKNMVRTGIYMPIDLLEALDTLAMDNHVDRSCLIRRLVVLSMRMMKDNKLELF